jgi:hypothetical protein
LGVVCNLIERACQKERTVGHRTQQAPLASRA